MNEKIKQILKQNEIYHDTNLQVDFTKDNSPLEMLIKNIINECVNTIRNEPFPKWAEAGDEREAIIENINYRFGMTK